MERDELAGYMVGYHAAMRDLQVILDELKGGWKAGKFGPYLMALSSVRARAIVRLGEVEEQWSKRRLLLWGAPTPGQANGRPDEVNGQEKQPQGFQVQARDVTTEQPDGERDGREDSEHAGGVPGTASWESQPSRAP